MLNVQLTVVGQLKLMYGCVCVCVCVCVCDTVSALHVDVWLCETVSGFRVTMCVCVCVCVCVCGKGTTDVSSSRHPVYQVRFQKVEENEHNVVYFFFEGLQQ